jgi:CheY-like chemotaxis protein
MSLIAQIVCGWPSIQTRSAAVVKFQNTHSNTELSETPSEVTILQVENSRANAELVKQIVARRVDLKLLTATDGVQGIEMARRFQPSLILMDFMMPQMNGIEALTLLRECSETSHIPVIFLSSNAFSDIKEKCLKAGAFSFLTKPYKIEVLLASIDAGLKSVTATR